MKTLNLAHYPQYAVQFRSYLNSLCPVSDTLWKKLSSKIKLQRVESGHFILKYLEVENAVRFIGKGIVKCTDTYNGKSYVFDFRVAPIAICESVSILNDTPSHISLEAITECDLIVLSKEAFNTLVNKDLDCSKLAMLRIASYLELTQYKQTLLRTFTAEERYKQFLKEFPTVATTCKQEDIASYLNLKPQSLSRIRKTITWTEDEKQLKSLSDEIAVIGHNAELTT